MALSMFSAVPLRSKLWDDSCMNLMLPCFPLVGVLLGSFWWGLSEILVFADIHIMLMSAILAVTPFLLSGFLHLDGYMDTSDAILSRKPLEDKLRILKDPHPGAFAVIMLAVLFLLQFAAMFAALDGGAEWMLLAFIVVISRCCSAIAMLSLKAMPQSSYANLFRENSGAVHKGFVMMVLILTLGAACLLTGMQGLIVAAAVVLGFTCAMAYSYNEFKGNSGDLTGFSLVVSELCGLIALATVQLVI